MSTTEHNFFEGLEVLGQLKEQRSVCNTRETQQAAQAVVDAQTAYLVELSKLAQAEKAVA